MSASVLVAYASRSGSTQEVAESIAATLRERGLTVAARDRARPHPARAALIDRRDCTRADDPRAGRDLFVDNKMSYSITPSTF